MAQVSVGQVENLQELMIGLQTVREAMESACREQLDAADRLCSEAQGEAQNSEGMLENALSVEQEAQQALDGAYQNLEDAEEGLNDAQSALSACCARPADEDGGGPDCSDEADGVDAAQEAVAASQAAVEESQNSLTQATENRQQMEQRVECAKQALMMARNALEQVQQECSSRMNTVDNAIETGIARLAAAQQALDSYLAANLPASQFYSWLHWQPIQGKPITPDVIRDRMNLDIGQQRQLQEYLRDRVPDYRHLVDKYRGEWAAAKGDVERNIVNRKACIHISGKFAEQMARHALAPLGGRIETQGRTFVGENGRYTKTDLIVTDLRVPVILGRGENMGAPVGGSMAFEVKCGKANYLYAQKEHMVFQAEGHKQADAHCTLCSRDIRNLSPEKEKELRDALTQAGSPVTGMLPEKNDIDRSCLEFIRQDEDTRQ